VVGRASVGGKWWKGGGSGPGTDVRETGLRVPAFERKMDAGAAASLVGEVVRSLGRGERVCSAPVLLLMSAGGGVPVHIEGT